MVKTVVSLVISAIMWTTGAIAQSDGQYSEAERAVIALIHKQEAAWNSGDLVGFMAGYWHSDELMFISARGITLGWKATLANYQKHYSTSSIMGQLTFDLMYVEEHTPTLVTVVGEYHLVREQSEGSHGIFSLIVKKFDDAWFVVSDHTSVFH